MASQVEDHVDWSDGTLGSPDHILSIAAAGQSRELSPVFSIDYATKANERAGLKSPSPLPLRLPITGIEGRPREPRLTPVHSRNQTKPPIDTPKVTSNVTPDNTGIVLHRTRQKFLEPPPAPVHTYNQIETSNDSPEVPLSDTLLDFGLYQANQKLYEVIFLKSFLTHALSADTMHLKESLEVTPEALTMFETYLGSVLDNVDKITEKMTWNTHNKTVNFLTSHGREHIPFLNVEKFKQHIFADFEPSNTTSIVGRMNQSWHRVYQRSVMARYFADDYPQDAKHRSPLLEVQEARNTHLRCDHTMPHGRVFKPPLKKVHGQYATSVPNKPPVTSQALIPSEQYEPPLRKRGRPSTRGRSTNKTRMDVSSVGGLATTGIEALKAGSETPALGVDVSRLEKLVAKHGIKDLETLVARSNQPQAPCQPRPQWKVRALQDHKRRLVQRRRRVQQSQDDLPCNLKSVIERAVANGIILPLALKVKQQLDAFAARAEIRATRTLSTHAFAQDQSDTHAYPPRQTIDGPVFSGRGRGRGSGTRRSGAPLTRKREITQVDEVTQPEGKRQRFAISDIPRKRFLTAADARRFERAQRKLQKSDLFVEQDKHQEEQPAPQKKANVQGPKKKSLKPNADTSPLPPHPSGSKTLEPHQVLPEGAYFAPAHPNDKLAYRCGIKHALGYYYNAGDRKSCNGCFTNISDNKYRKEMDFYLPTRHSFHQPAPGIIWRPSKSSGKERKSSAICDNGIAKDYYWKAIEASADEDEALDMAIKATIEHLKPKPKREATPSPTPEPEPEPEPLPPVPHASGSATMEHGQGIPRCAYFSKRERYEEFAWRCDGGHALGRYYMAGDKRSCPGCGSNKTGGGRRKEMDFYMSPGAVVRQEAPGLVKWNPRKPYKTKGRAGGNKGAEKERMIISHNQMCTKLYWEAIEEGMATEEGLRRAVKETDAYLDARDADFQEGVVGKEKDQDADVEMLDAGAGAEEVDSDTELSDVESSDHEGEEVGGAIISLAPNRRDENMESDDDDLEHLFVFEEEAEGEAEGEHTSIISISDDSSDDLGSSSSSDSE